jgi:ABC-type nickel/cobalt efflux system permease component RcnA
MDRKGTRSPAQGGKRMRRLATRLLGFCLPILAAHVRAHDIPNARVDRSIQVSLDPGRMEVDYEVSLSELTLTRDLRMLVGTLPGVDRQDWFQSYGRETGPLNGRGLLVAIDRRPFELGFRGFELTVEDHPRFLFHYQAATPPGGHLTVQDANFAGSEGTSRLAIRGRGGVVVRGDDLPGDVEAIAIRPVWQLSDGEERRTKYVEVDFTAPMVNPRAPEAPRPEQATRLRPAAAQTASSIRTERGIGSAQLTRLLDRTARLPTLGLVLMAMGLGAVHSLQPGHGKTLVAAAVLGERGTWSRGVLLALLTTLTHTGSVLLVALGLWWTQTEQYGAIHLGLAHAAGGLIAAIGFWRLGRHLARFGEHDVPAPAPEPSNPDTLKPDQGLVGLGIAGGLVPCWDAIVLILLAEATGRLALGIALLLAFGLGMGLVLVVVGVLAGRVRRRVVRGRGLDPEAYGPWERGLGLASGLTLAVIGIYLLGLA